MLHSGEEDSKKKKKELCQSRDQQVNMSSYFIATSSSTASSPIASKSPEMPIASGKPDSRWVLNQAHSTQRRRLKCESRMHTLVGWWKSSGETRRIKRKKIQKTPTILRLEPGTVKEKPIAQDNEAWENTVAYGTSSSVDQESQKNTEATWDHCLQISPNTSHFLEAIFSMVRKI